MDLHDKPGSRTVAAARLAAAMALVLGTAGCDIFHGGPKKPPLPGERISVLAHEQDLKPDVQDPNKRILLPPPSVNPSWPQAGGYANHAMHHILVSDDLKRAWRADVGSGTSRSRRLVAAPIVADGRVYAIDAKGHVSTFDAGSGARLWRVAITPKDEDDGHIDGGLAFEAGRVFAAGGFGQVVALDAATGQEQWRQATGGPLRSAPTVRGGRVFVITVDNRLIAFDAATGAQLWTHGGIGEAASLLGGASPAEDGGVVVAPFSSGELVALRAENGRVLWTESLATTRRTTEVAALAHIRGRPVIDRGRVFAMSNGGILVALDLRSGRRIWEREIGGLESPWVAGNYVYVVTNEGEMVSLSRDDGTIYWVSPLPRYENEKKKEGLLVWSGPVLVTDRLVVVGSNGEALAVSPYTGRILGRIEMPDGISVAPVVADGAMYFLTDDASLIAYR